ncbi:hypothetical protein LVD17_00515 [Fulvivirga ulvae]|uniref:hypothetical protein n=1 Tax=Fulvivirga ulvae TaxID=2904245 RepID=UPI001F16A7EE|nr:hypothetical protein [Fulvivirga ulvae]UII32320.1 hypothetical protein LVD17_00515 [Fulvivirga ulvae]
MKFLKPWHDTDENLEVQLRKEISVGHILYGKEVKTIARRQDNDDVLFKVADTDFQYAMVHLTWSSKSNPDSTYPLTRTFKDADEVFERLILEDNNNWV